MAMSVQIADFPSLAGDRTPIPVNYVRNLVELVHEFGLDTDRLLAHVGLTQAEVYSAEPALRFEQFQRVTILLWMKKVLGSQPIIFLFKMSGEKRPITQFCCRLNLCRKLLQMRCATRYDIIWLQMYQSGHFYLPASILVPL
jgi:hypothetical protein